MPSYDPQRSRSRRRVADDEGPAPVDALLGPPPATDPVEPRDSTLDPDPAAVDAPVPPTTDAPVPSAAEAGSDPGAGTEARPEPLIVDLDQPAPVTVPRDRGRLVLVAVALGSIAVQVALFLWWRRRRARGGAEASPVRSRRSRRRPT